MNVVSGSSWQRTILTKFEDLFGRWLEIKHELDEQLYALGSEPDETQIDDQLKLFQRELLKLLATSDQGDIGLSRDERANVNELNFALAAYWDDFLLQRYQWSVLSDESKAYARKYWLKLLVESEIFGTRSAGRGFPKAIRKLVRRDRYSEADLPLLGVYARLLWLGFGPKDPKVQKDHSLLRDDAITIINAQSKSAPAYLEQDSLGWMPLPGKKVERMAPVARWKSLFLRAASVSVILSLLIWIGLVYQLKSGLLA